jgi:hypothetical protein
MPRLPGHWLGQMTGPGQLDLTWLVWAGSNSAQTKIKRKKLRRMVLVPGPNQPNLFWAKGVFGKIHLYILSFLFHPFLFCYLAKQVFSYIKNSENICGPSLIYLWFLCIFLDILL